MRQKQVTCREHIGGSEACVSERKRFLLSGGIGRQSRVKNEKEREEGGGGDGESVGGAKGPDSVVKRVLSRSHEDCPTRTR